MSSSVQVKLPWRSLFLPIAISIVLCLDAQSINYSQSLDAQTGQAIAQQIISPLQYLRMGAAYICLNMLYVLWLWRQFKPKTQAQFKAFRNSIEPLSIPIEQPLPLSFRQLLQRSSPFLLLAILFYPTTTDLYAYLHSGTILLEGANPYLVAAKDYTSIFSPYLVWGQTSTYGPVSQIFFVISAFVSRFDFLSGIYLFKIFCVLFHVASAYAIWRQLRSHSSRSLWTAAYLLCPPLIFELIAQAHVDVFLCATLVALIFCLRQRRFLLSTALLWIGFLTKTLPVLWMPFLAAWLVRQREWKVLGWAIALSMTVISVLTLTLFPNLQAWRSLFNPGVNWQTAGSLHNILAVAIHYIQIPFPTALFGAKSYRIVMGFRWLSTLGFLIYYSWLLGCIAFAPQPNRLLPSGWFTTIRRCFFSRWIGSEMQFNEMQLIAIMGWSLLILFLFAMPWYKPWYATSLVPFVILLRGRSTQSFRLIAGLFCFTSTVYHLLAIPNAPEVMFGLVSAITVLPAIALLFWRSQVQSSSVVQPVPQERQKVSQS
jgi:alpha-1,6-mannosyltransferase